LSRLARISANTASSRRLDPGAILRRISLWDFHHRLLWLGKPFPGVSPADAILFFRQITVELFDADGHNTDVTAVEQSELAIPPRFRWLKRLMLFAIFDAVLLGGAFCWWSWYADSQVQAEIHKLRDQGQPVSLSDFSMPPIPDTENAAYYFDRAERELLKAEGKAPTFGMPSLATISVPMLFGATPPSINALLSERSPSDPLIWQVEQNALVPGPRPGTLTQKRIPFDMSDEVHQAAAAIELTVEASTHAKAAGYSASGFAPFATNGLAPLAMVLDAAASMAHKAGNDADVLAKIEISMHLANSLDQGIGLRPEISSQIHEMNSISIWWLSNDLDVTDNPETALSKSASRDRVMLLIAELLDIEPYQKAIARYWLYQRADFLNQLQSGALATSYKTSSYQTPAMQIDAIPIIRYYTQMADCAVQPNFPLADSKSPSMPMRIDEDIFSEAHPLARFPVPGHDLTVEFNTILYRRVAAISLALRLYFIDHDGHWPSGLSELVPQFLPTIPADPFSKGNTSIGYVTNPWGGPDLSSAGLVFHLSPMPPASRQAGKDNR
jgi:hypothetical protein